jgi:hypothetical protein
MSASWSTRREAEFAVPIVMAASDSSLHASLNAVWGRATRYRGEEDLEASSKRPFNRFSPRRTPDECQVGLSRNSPPRLKLGLGLDRIVLAEPLLNLFPLRGQHDTLPFHHTSTLIVLSHYVQTLIEDLDEAVKL